LSINFARKSFSASLKLIHAFQQFCVHPKQLDKRKYLKFCQNNTFLTGPKIMLLS